MGGGAARLEVVADGLNQQAGPFTPLPHLLLYLHQRWFSFFLFRFEYVLSLAM